MEDVSVSTDIALCRGCGERWGYAELLARKEAGGVAAMPPPGAWHVPGMNGFEAGASTRSPIAFFLVPFMCVWSGFSLSGIYGTQIISGKFNLVLSLFGIPFLLGTVVMGAVALMAVCGKVVVTVRGDDATVFVGIGPLGRSRRFKWSQVTGVSTVWNFSRRGQGTEQIVIEADRQIKLHALNAARQRFLLAVLNLHRKG
ncbi:MAG: hypothetical protein B7Z55_09725 [Planctomycetales bacterium 12-60-4]|nr:MAG: hypothetical protein B7Z55_09725 [Planctomycetales bacterium 12-60-4]